MTNTETTKALDEAVRELEAAREAARLKVRLLSMDTQRAWHDLEGKIEALTFNLKQRSEKAAESSAVAARDLARSVRQFIQKQM